MNEDLPAMEDTREVIDAKRRLKEIGVEIGICGGNCPVQIDGTFRDQPFYFRARGSRWRTWIGPGAQVLRDSSLYEEREYRPEGTSDDDARYVAGWMPEEVAIDLLRGSLERWAGLRA